MAWDQKSSRLSYNGGEIYLGNWSVNQMGEESWAEYVAASVAETQRYVEAYVRRNDDTYWFVPSFINEAGYWTLPRH